MLNQPRIQLVVTDENSNLQYLDVDDTSVVSLTYRIADIQDISSTDTSVSKNISLPETDNNRQVLGFISDLSVNSVVNPNLKIPCTLLVDSLINLEGNLQLLNVNVNENTKSRRIECVISSSNNTLWTEMGEKYLTDISLLEYNHAYTADNIIHSWTQSYINGYYYGMIDYGSDWHIQNINGIGTPLSITISDWLPGIYVKTVWNKIFQDVGLQYESDFLNSDIFNNLYLPSTIGSLTQSATYSNDKVFVVGENATQSYYIHNPAVNNPTPNPPFNTDYWFSKFGSGVVGGIFDTYCYDNQISFDNTSQDINNLYDATYSSYTAPNNVNDYNQRFGAKINFIIKKPFIAPTAFPIKYWLRVRRSSATQADFDNGIGWSQNNPGLNYGDYGYPGLSVHDSALPLAYFPAGSSVPVSDICTITSIGGGNYRAEMNNIYFTDTIYSNLSPTASVPNTPLNYKLIPGEKVWLSILMTTQYDQASNPIVDPGFNFIDILPGSQFSNEIDKQFMPNQILSLSNVLPTQMYQKDFVQSIIKMFNLLVIPSKSKKNTLKIEPRDDYYATGIVRNMTSKVDKNQDIKEDFLSLTQNRTTKFTYTDDDDYFNTDYLQRTKQTYGQYKYNIENDFITDEKSITIPFVPTPMVNIVKSHNFPVPVIGKVNNGVFSPSATKAKILLKSVDGMVSLTGGDSFTFNGHKYTSYPYAGHFDDPFNPTIDINWGQCQLMYYPNGIVTDQQLVPKYWIKMLDEISDINSRLVTVQMRLDSYDIANFEFNDQVLLNLDGVNEYYKWNTIENYNPAITGGLSTVTLIKSKDVILPTPATQSIFTVPYGGHSTLYTNYNNLIIGQNSGVIGTLNNVNGTNTLINGDLNTSLGNNILINGNNNYTAIGVTNSILFGDDNVINNSNNMVIGNNNYIPSGITNSFIYGNDITATQSNTFIIGPSVSLYVSNINGVTISQSLTQKYAATVSFTADTTQTITHGLGTTDIIIQMYDSSHQQIIAFDTNAFTGNSVDIRLLFSTSARVIIIG